MNIYDLTNYVNLDVDDTFTVAEIVSWFNKAIANFNLVEPMTKYPYAFVGDDEDIKPSPTAYPSHSATGYVLDDTILLGVILPFLIASVKSQESSLGERQTHLQDFVYNAQKIKAVLDIPVEMLYSAKAQDVQGYKLADGVYVADMSYAPFSGDWGRGSSVIPEFPLKEE